MIAVLTIIVGVIIFLAVCALRQSWEQTLSSAMKRILDLET